MECNKDEALRAKSIAEDKLGKKDFLRAKKFALKAQALYPALDGMSRMLTTLEVYVSAEKKINGAVDWYGVLGVGPTADDETIKKQYQKLAIVLRPDENDSDGANDAFNLISEAWTLLSDKAKRSAYHQITGLKGFESKAPTHTLGPAADHTGGPSPSTYTDGDRNGGPSDESPFSKFAKKKTPAPKSQNKRSAKAAGPTKPSPPPTNQRTHTFWTICSHCRVQYEYKNLYRNMTLRCPDCKKAFNALEIPPPIRKSRPQKPNRGPAQPPKSNNNNLRTPPPDKNLRTPPSANVRGRTVASKKSGKDTLHTPPSANDRGKNVASDAQKPGVGQAGEKNCMHAAPHSASANVNRSGIAAKVASFGDQLKRAACASSKNGSVGMNGFSKKRKLDKGHKNYNKIPEKKNVNGTASTVNEAVVMRKLMLENARKEVLRKLNDSGFEGPVVNPKVNCTIEARERINGNGLKECHKNAGSDSSTCNTTKQIDGTDERDGKINKNAQECPPPPTNQRTDTFWTICSHCRVRYEYQNLYRNMTLRCPDCKKAFNALEIPPPIRKSRPQKPNPGPPQPLKPTI